MILWFEGAGMSVDKSSLLRQNIDAAVIQFQTIAELGPQVLQAAELVLECLTSGNKLLICGNGGSAADASHLATEFVCRYREDRRPYPAISLNDVGSTLTAVGNDYKFDDVFSRQVRAFAQPGDILIVLTTSGKSPDIRDALKAAAQAGIHSIAFLGRDGGYTRGLATVDLLVRGENTARIQEAQKLLYHTICEIVELDLPKA
jgi:D-sedoheptulose 7-phosphate isomerase